MAVSWMCTSSPARGRGWLMCTLPTLPQSQNLCAWALLTLSPVLPFHAPVRTGGEPRPSRRFPTFPAAECVCVCVCIFRSIGLGLEGTESHQSRRVAWQGAFSAERTRGSTANLVYVCSVVDWPCPACSCGCCRLDCMLYTMG